MTHGPSCYWLSATLALARRPPTVFQRHPPQVSVELANTYRAQYKIAKDTLAAAPKSKQFDFDEQAIFMKLDLFCKRLHKLIDLFTTIWQFSSLEQHTHIEGLEAMLKNLNNIIDDVKRKPYDLLDYTKNAFDRDFLEFNVNINDLEMHLQRFVKDSFENITSTEHALSLLAQFQAIMQRESLKQVRDGGGVRACVCADAGAAGAAVANTAACMRDHTAYIRCAYCVHAARVSGPRCSPCPIPPKL